MKNLSLLLIMLCVSHAGFAELKVTSGNVEIGSVNAGANLYVNGFVKAKNYLYLTGASDANVGSYLTIENSNKTGNNQGLNWTIYNMTGIYNDALYFYVYDKNPSCTGLCAPRLILMDDGRVGIGKIPTANAKLDVAGNIYVNGTTYIGSDGRLKTNIKPLFDEKEKLYLLQGKSYKKTLPPTGLEELSSEPKKEIAEFSEYGYLAQELKEVFPDLVSRDSAGYYAVNYIGLIPVIVEALKEQRSEKQREIDELRKQIDEQREQMKQLVKLSINEKAFEENGIESIALLLQNTPNPFNQTTEIGYYIPETVNSAHIYIYDINGFQQKSISISGRGKGATTLQASALQAGIYFYTLICDGKPVDTKQMILTR